MMSFSSNVTIGKVALRKRPGRNPGAMDAPYNLKRALPEHTPKLGRTETMPCQGVRGRRLTL